MKTITKYTPGPWAIETDFSELCVIGPDGVQVADCSILSPRRSGIMCHQNAELIQQSPAMLLALSLIEHGVARIERSGSLSEFCFGGIRYCMNGDWSGLLSIVGWDNARAALARVN
jgi:hypothetical protein